jgi:hypothetical protein
LYEAATALEARLREQQSPRADLVATFTQAFDVVMETALTEKAEQESAATELVQGS